MKCIVKLLVVILICVLSGVKSSEVSARNFVNEAELKLEKARQKLTIVRWAYNSNITVHNEKVKLQKDVSNLVRILKLIIDS